MPGPLIPKKSGVHRAACFALYRALLRQSHKLPILQQQRLQYNDLVKSKTRANARLQGHWNITIALRLGYETLDAVQDEARRPAILERIAELSVPPLRCIPKVKTNPPSDNPKLEHPVTTKSPFLQQRRLLPRRSPVLQRPYPVISGRRHVPKLVDANRVPILRIRKPQSKLLGALIRSTVRTREKRLHKSRELEELARVGSDEDEWDWILHERFNLEEQGGSWTKECTDSFKEIKGLHDASMDKRRRIAREMTIIVEKEKALAQEERAALRQMAEAKQETRHDIRHGSAVRAKALANNGKVESHERKVLGPTKEVKWNPFGNKSSGHT